MKYIVILGDGMAGYPLPDRDNKTCLQLAKTPFFDELAKKSAVGLMKTVPDGYKPGSDVANLSVMGYDPAEYYSGRSPLEAASIGIDLKDTDVTLRCNLVTLSEEEPYENKTGRDLHRGGARAHRRAQSRVRPPAVYAVRGHFLPSLPRRRGRKDGA